ncbi:MAG: NAD(P)H-dependent glycerol-3-phosphate dehydrogenase [Bacillota bacterium]
MTPRSRIAVVGAGSWGTALACVIARTGAEVRIWGRREEQMRAMTETRHNPDYLKDYELPRRVFPSADLDEVVEHAHAIIVVPASHGMRDTAELLKEHYPRGVPLVSATKGLEPATGMRMTEVLGEILDLGDAPELAALSGPNFAVEVVAGLPAGTVVASADEAVAREVQQLASGRELRVYTSDDLTGVELGGALKNVYAIAVGIIHSLGLGVNAQATLITRGLAELTRLGVHLGAHPLTFAGLSGLGDLVLTCTSDLSRNRRAGLALGRGRSPQAIRSSRTTVEGMRATWAARDLAADCGVEMPIVGELYAILYEDKDPRDALEDLMNRDLRTERDEQYDVTIQEFLRRSDGVLEED